jgi:3-methyladenine DNA glycosylase AlkC
MRTPLIKVFFHATHPGLIIMKNFALVLLASTFTAIVCCSKQGCNEIQRKYYKSAATLSTAEVPKKEILRKLIEVDFETNHFLNFKNILAKNTAFSDNSVFNALKNIRKSRSDFDSKFISYLQQI